MTNSDINPSAPQEFSNSSGIDYDRVADDSTSSAIEYDENGNKVVTGTVRSNSSAIIPVVDVISDPQVAAEIAAGPALSTEEQNAIGDKALHERLGLLPTEAGLPPILDPIVSPNADNVAVLPNADNPIVGTVYPHPDNEVRINVAKLGHPLPLVDTGAFYFDGTGVQIEFEEAAAIVAAGGTVTTAARTPATVSEFEASMARLQEVANKTPADVAPLREAVKAMSPGRVLRPGKRKIAIVGFVFHWNETPWDDLDWDIWCMNNFHAQAGAPWQKATAWFDIHQREERDLVEGHVAWLESGGPGDRPYVTPEGDDRVKNSVKLPRDQIVDALGGSRYFTNSVSWLLGHAMWELLDAHAEWATGKAKIEQGLTDERVSTKGTQERLEQWDKDMQPAIGLYGVDMASNTEYGAQRPSCEWLIGLAQGLGFKVEMAAASDLLKTSAEYGMGADKALRTNLQARRKDMERQLSDAQKKSVDLGNEQGQVNAQIHNLQGQLAENSRVLFLWTMPDAKRDKDGNAV